MEDTELDTPPTRPPNRSQSGGRPPKGPRRMPRRSRRLDPEFVRERLAVLSGRLKTSAPPVHPNITNADFAEVLDEVLEVRRTEPSTARVNLALWMASTVKAALEAKAEAEALTRAQVSGGPVKNPGTVLGEVIDQGFERFLKGEFIPERPLKKPRGKGPEIRKANLNVRASGALRDQVQELCPAWSIELGWSVTPGLVAMSWLFSEYGITEDDQIGVTVPDLSGLHVQVPVVSSFGVVPGWPPQQCATFLGIKRADWIRGVQEGKYPQPIGQTAGIDTWNANEVRQIMHG